MPTYTAACLECGKVQDYFRKISDSSDTPVCCDRKTTKMLSTPMVSAMTWTDHKGFYIAGTNEWIGSGQEYKAYMDRHGLIPESEGKQEVAIQQANKKAADERKLHDTVLEAYRRHAS